MRKIFLGLLVLMLLISCTVGMAAADTDESVEDSDGMAAAGHYNYGDNDESVGDSDRMDAAGQHNYGDKEEVQRRQV